MDPQKYGNGGLDGAFETLYGELHSLASRQMARERLGHTLQPTALVNEAYLKLRHQKEFHWEDQAHFTALAARAMRQVLIDLGRKRAAAKRPAGRTTVDLDSLERTGEMALEDSLEIHMALERLSGQPPAGERQARLIEWVWFGGMSFTEAADLLGVSRRQAHRDWAWARTWLAHELAAG